MKHLTAAAAALLLAVAGGVAAPSYAAEPTCQGRAVTIAATADRQVLNGTAGPDVISADGFIYVTIHAHGGDDVICTGDRNGGTVHGGDGNDSIEGLGTLHGDGGDDRVVLVPAPTSPSRTTLKGGPGNDLLDASAEPNPDTPYGRLQLLLPGPGDDTILGTKAAQLSFDGGDGVRISVPDGTVDGQGHDTISGVTDFIGSRGRDSFVGSVQAERWLGNLPLGRGAHDVVDSAGGDDRLQGSGTLVGGAGADDVLLLGARGLADGGPGDDDVRANSNASGLVPRSGTLRGGAGDDRVGVARSTKPRGSRFRFRGGAGDDRIQVAFARSEEPCRSSVCRDLIDGGSGRDKVTFGYSRVRVNLGTGKASYGGGSRAAVRGIEDVTGDWGRDVLIGDGGPNVLDGRRGGDVLVGGGGVDEAYGRNGNDTCRAEMVFRCDG